MGTILKLTDSILFLFFLIIAIAAPLIDSQTILPSHIFPEILINLKQWYTNEYGDYLIKEKPHFFVGIVWLELIFQWPLALINLYGILGSKSWLHTTCLIYGSSVLTSMVAILSDLVWSGKGSEKLMMMYLPFLGFAVLAILRGLVAKSSGGSPKIGKKPAIMARKKRA